MYGQEMWVAYENAELVMWAQGVDIEKRRGRVMALLAEVGLEGMEDRMPSELSGGQQQRVAIARAIAKNPDVLLCDEPTGALDSKTGIVVLEALQRVNQELGTTTAVITHNAGIAQMADRVIHLADGRISQVDTNETKLEPSQLSW